MTAKQFYWHLFSQSFEGGFAIAHGIEGFLAMVLGFLFFNHHLEGAWAWLFAVPFAVFLVTFLFGHYRHSYAIYREAAEVLPAHMKEVNEAHDVLKREIADVHATCQQYFHLGSAINANYAIRSEEMVLSIEADGTLDASWTVRSVARERISMIKVKFEGEHSLKWISDLDIRLASETGHRLGALPAQNTPTSKAILLLFIPDLEPSDSEISYTVRWKWQGLWEPLLNNKVDYWGLKVRGTETVPLVRFNFRVAKDLPPITLSNAGEGLGKTVLPNSADQVREYRDFIWEMADVKAGANVAVKLHLA